MLLLPLLLLLLVVVARAHTYTLARSLAQEKLNLIYKMRSNSLRKIIAVDAAVTAAATAACAAFVVVSAHTIPDFPKICCNFSEISLNFP